MQKETVLTLANTARATIMADVEQNLVSRVNSLSNQVANKADLATVQALEVEVTNKADKSTVQSLATEVSSKADKSSVQSLAIEIANKADKSSVTQDIVFVKEVDFVNGSFTTGTIKVVDGIITEII